MKHLDPTSKRLRPLAEYSRRLPSSQPGKRLHKATLFRWATRGARRAILRTCKLGSGRFTCDAWVAEFIAHQSRLDPLTAPSRPKLSDADRKGIESELGILPDEEADCV